MTVRLFERNITLTFIVMYSLYLYFLGPLRNTPNALELFKAQKRSRVAIWDWIQRFGSSQIYDKRKRVSAFIIDETVIQISNQYFWLLMCIEPIHSSVLGIYISKERNMFVAENFSFFSQQIWKTYNIHRWQYMISSSLYIFAFET